MWRITTESVSLCGVLVECNRCEPYQETPCMDSRVWESLGTGSIHDSLSSSSYNK